MRLSRSHVGLVMVLMLFTAIAMSGAYVLHNISFLYMSIFRHLILCWKSYIFIRAYQFKSIIPCSRTLWTTLGSLFWNLFILVYLYLIKVVVQTNSIKEDDKLKKILIDFLKENLVLFFSKQI